MRFAFILTAAILFSAGALGQVARECQEWFKTTGIDAKSRACFRSCFTSNTHIFNDCWRECDDLCTPELKIWLYFGNGMFNTIEDARESLEILNEKLYPFLKSKYPSTLRFLVPQGLTELAYNTNLGAIIQFLEAMGQKADGSFVNFFYWLSGLKIAPEWFQKQMVGIGTNARFTTLVLDSDLKRQLNNYLLHLKKGDAVLVVAHSQGNLYRDGAFHLLDILTGRPQIPRFGSVSVATPSGNASPGIIPMGRRWYTTLFSDLLIAKMPTSLPANTRNDPSGLFDHFWMTYLEGNRSGPKILQDIACVLSKLNGVLISPTTRDYNDGCHPETEDELLVE